MFSGRVVFLFSTVFLALFSARNGEQDVEFAGAPPPENSQEHTWAAPKIWGGSKSPKSAEAGPKMLFLYCFKSEN